MELKCSLWFHQTPLDLRSTKLTTFITLLGTYYYTSLLFGITPTSKYFYRIILGILGGVTGTVNMINDVLIFGKNKKEYDKHLGVALEKMQSCVDLNEEKPRFSKDRIIFLGQVIDESGVHLDPNKVSTIMKIGHLENISDIRHFLRMFNQLSKFVYTSLGR